MADGINTRVPIAPLLTWWQSRRTAHQRSNCVCTQGGVCASIECLADRVGTSRSTMFRRIADGSLTMGEADRWATRLGEHPMRIWPGWDRAPVRAALTPRPPGAYSEGTLFR